jgi:hypothetical protein
LSHDHNGLDDVDDLREQFRQERVPLVSVWQHDLHELPLSRYLATITGTTKTTCRTRFSFAVYRRWTEYGVFDKT